MNHVGHPIRVISWYVVANVGDSRAVICCENGLAKQLSVDHNPSNEMEREAVKKKGAFEFRH